MKKIYLILVSVLLLSACTTEIPTSPTHVWGDYSLHLESRPPIIEQGMVEFLTIVNFEEKLRGWDLIVYYRMGPTGRWVQAIQDGHTGVYRRAMMVNDPETEVLYVHVKKKQSREQKLKKEEQKETMIKFPLDYSTAAPSKSGS